MKSSRQEYMKAWYKKNPTNWREKHWKQQGIINSDGTPFKYTDFDRLYQIQQGRCAICKKHSSEFDRTLAADHDHKTGFIRGLLCLGCNSRLAVLEDIKFMKSASSYLEADHV